MTSTTQRSQATSPHTEHRVTSQISISPQFKLPSNPAAQVLRSIRLAGLIYRDQITIETGLSAATVNRQVAALLEAGIINERTNHLHAGAIGRPRMPVELNATGPLTIGVYIGAKSSTISIYDTLVRLIHAVNIPHHDTSLQAVTKGISDGIISITQRWKNRTFLRIGIALAGSVEERGKVDFPLLGWSEVPLAELLGQQTGFRVTIAPLVEAMAATELQHLSGKEAKETTLYFYAHDTIGTALIVGGAVRTARTGHTTIGQLPYALFPQVSDNPLTLLDPQGRGKFDDAVSESAVLSAAQYHGLSVKGIDCLVKLAQQGDTTAKTLLTERAALLGAGISLVSDILNPDRIVLGGQAFTDMPQYLPHVAKEIAARIIGVRHPVHITSSKQYVQQRASGAVALDRLFHDPIAELTSGKVRKYSLLRENAL